MRIIVKAFHQLVIQIMHDRLLVLISVIPFLCGILFRYGIPYAEVWLAQRFAVVNIFSPYSLLLDLLLVLITPYIFCFMSAMIILDEMDAQTARSLIVSPLMKTGYLISRIVFPAFFALLISMLVLALFSLTNISGFETFLLSFAASLMGVTLGCMVVVFAGNKVEGMAFSKLGGIILLGAPLPFFLEGNLQYIGSFLPSFWIAKMALECSLFHIAMTFIIAGVWLFVLFKRFNRKLI